MALSGNTKSYIQTALGHGPAATGRDRYIDMVLELTPVVLPGPATTTLYVSMFGYSRVTGNKQSLPRLQTPIGFRVSVLADSIGQELPDGSINFAQFQTGQLEVGEFLILNPDGAMDAWATDYGWGNALAELKIGRMDDAYTSFETVLCFSVRDEPWYEFRQGSIHFEPKSALVNYNARIQSNLFAGTGGWEGGSDLAGQAKPLLLGVRRNIPLQLVDYANLRYAASDGQDGIQALVSGYEGGFPAGGAWTLQAADGGVTLPNAPQQPVSAHIQGEKFDGGVYSASQGKIIEEIINRVNAGVTVNASDVAAFTDTAGLFVPTNSSRTLGDALDFLRLPLGIGPYPAQDASELRIGTITAPTSPEDETYDYALGEILDIESRAISPPAWKVRIGYQGLDNVIDNPLATDAATKQFLSSEWRYKEAEDTSVLNSCPSAVVLTVPTALDDATQAQTAATSMLAIFKVSRRRWRITLAAKWFHSWIGDTVKVTYPRFGLDAGKYMLVTGLEISGGGPGGLRSMTYIMECWG